MNLPRLTFKKKEEKKEVIDNGQIDIVNELIKESQKNVADINSRITYLKTLQESVKAVDKVREQHRQIINFLINKTSADYETNSEINQLIESIKIQVEK